MIDLREPYQPEGMRLERIEVREKVAAAYVKGKMAGQLLADQRCRRAARNWFMVGGLAGVAITIALHQFGVLP